MALLRRWMSDCTAQVDSQETTMDFWNKEHNVDLLKSGLHPQFQDNIITYGELVQAAYDNLGVDKESNPGQYGNAMKAPEDFLSYLQGNYRLANPRAEPSNTYSRYTLPAATVDGLSPMFEGLPGKGAGKNPDPHRRLGVRNLKRAVSTRDTLWTKVCRRVPALLVLLVGGKMPLFDADAAASEPRGTFLGYVALSSEPEQPAESPGNKATDGSSRQAAEATDVVCVTTGSSSASAGSSAQSVPGSGQSSKPAAGRDVALVWRGTVFKEEWESNFCEDQLDYWDVDQWDYKIVPKADEVGVHAGFCDLYTRPVGNPQISQPNMLVQGGAGPPPRLVVLEWLKRLMKDNNITTITATGHSLGGALATLCAYDVAVWLKKEWGHPTKWADYSKGWKTEKPPTVRTVTFAAPRVGNAKFVEEFHRLGIQALRVENKGDIVPRVPGIFTNISAHMRRIFNPGLRGARAQVDTTHPLVERSRQRCIEYCRRHDNFPRRDPKNPEEAPRLARTSFMRWLQGPTWQHVWGFYHVGQVLQLDVAWVKVAPQDWQQQKRARFLRRLHAPDKHNLELHLYLVSLLQPTGPPGDAGATATRNPLLLNKSAGLLGDSRYPGEWWGAADHGGCRLQDDGRWVYEVQAAPVPAAAAAGNAGADVAAAAAAVSAAPVAVADDIQQRDQQSATAAEDTDDKAVGGSIVVHAFAPGVSQQ